MASSNSCASSHCLRSTHSCRSSAMCAGGPPKPMHPIRPHSRTTVPRPAWCSMATPRCGRAGSRSGSAARPPPGGTRRARVRLARRVGDAPVDQLRMAGELRADLADPVAQRDHVAEPLPGELLQVLGPAPADVDAVLAHDPHRLRMQRLGTAARAGRLDRAPGQLSEQRLGHLRAGAVPGAEEQHPGPRPGGAPARAGPSRDPGPRPGWRASPVSASSSRQRASSIR